MSFNPIYSVCGLWPEGVDFQTRYLGSSSVSGLAATHPVNLSGNCMPLPQEGVWSVFFSRHQLLLYSIPLLLPNVVLLTLQEHDVHLYRVNQIH